MNSIGVGQSLCNDFYCDCEFCESFGVPEGRRERFMASLRKDEARIKFYPCDHTLRDGLHYSQSSCQVTGRWVLSGVDGSERTIKSCGWCDEEADWDRQEEEWRASGGYWLDQDL